MKKCVLFACLLFAAACLFGQAASDSTGVRVSGRVNVGVSTELNTDLDQVSLEYTTNDPRLGTNSHNRYFSDVNDVSQNVHAVYGAELKLDFRPEHTLELTLEGANDREHAMGSRLEHLSDPAGNVLSSVKGQYHHPDERDNELSAAVDYMYRMRRPGEQLTLGYRYQWQSESAGVEQQVYDATGWSLYQENVLEQRISYQTHYAHVDYTLPVAKGHLLDWGAAYSRRLLQVHSEQDWDAMRVLEADYRHLMQYGGAYMRYRVKLGSLEAMARLEYRATCLQQRWLHDVLPTATLRYQFDSIHSLAAFYTIMLIRPDVQHLDTTRITDAYTTRYGNDQVVGVHVHNVALTYRMQLPRVTGLAEVRYLTANDGFNAIWMERDGRRIYTWGNEGVRHAVGLTLTADSHLGPTTGLVASANVMWDKRVAEAINLENANWGVKANMRLTQLLFARSIRQTGIQPGALQVNMVLRGDYAYHNTLDVYSYAGHGGSVAGDLEVNIRKALKMGIGYTCLFKPDIHIIQGAYVGTIAYRPGATHVATLRLSYNF